MKDLSSFYLIIQSIDKNKYKKKLRRGDGKIDIVQMKSTGLYRIWSAHKIEQLPIFNVSKNSSEPRPYVYEVDEYELRQLFPGVNTEILDGDFYTESEKNKLEEKLAEYM